MGYVFHSFSFFFFLFCSKKKKPNLRPHPCSLPALAPFNKHKVWEMYKQAVASFWTVDEVRGHGPRGEARMLP